MERVHDAAIKLESPEPQRASLIAASRAADGWWLFCALVLAIKLLLLWMDATPKLFMGDSGAYHLYGADRLDSRGSIVLLRLPGTLVGGLAAQFWSTFIRSGALQRCNIDCVCADL